MAGHRSVAFISGMICSTDKRLSKAMQIPQAGSESLTSELRMTSVIWLGRLGRSANQCHRYGMFIDFLKKEQSAADRAVSPHQPISCRSYGARFFSTSDIL